MAKAEEIIKHLDRYMNRFPNTKNGNWCVGVAVNADKRLFEEHKVHKLGVWACHVADSFTIAKQVEAAYMRAGCQGAIGGSKDRAARTVYVYLKTSTTKP